MPPSDPLEEYRRKRDFSRTPEPRGEAPSDAVWKEGLAVAPPVRPKEILFPGEHLTRSDLLAYYERVADRMLPYLADRPLTLIVCRENIFACKFTKYASNLPSEVRAIGIAGHEEPYIAVDSRQGLLALVRTGTVEFHGWGSRYLTLEYPDRLVLDLDPSEEGVPWERLGEGALLVRNHLLDSGLDSFIMTTGGKGYYVVAPLRPEKAWKRVTGFARRFAKRMAELYPDRFTASFAMNERRGKIYLDWMRNGRGSNSTEPYCVRARKGAPVAMPIAWEELVEGVRPDSFSLLNVEARLATGEDPWRGFFEAAGMLEDTGR